MWHVRSGCRLLSAVAVPFLLFNAAQCAAAHDAPQTARQLVDLQGSVPVAAVVSSPQVSLKPGVSPASAGLCVSIQPGPDNYPGVAFHPPAGAWDLSAYGHISARVVNTSDQPLSIALRVDNAGDWRDNPWNTESVTLPPGEVGDVTTLFGYSYGFRPGFSLNPRAVVNVLLFTGKSDSARSFRIESLVASGPAGEMPPTAPNDVRIDPVDGFLLGGTAPSVNEKQIEAHGVRAETTSHGIDVVVPAGSGDSFVALKPTIGRWDLRRFLEIRVRVQNTGSAPVTPRVRIDSNGGPSEWFKASAPVAPGSEVTIAVRFAGAAPGDLGLPETLNRFTSDAASAVDIGAPTDMHDQQLRVTVVRAAVPPVAPLPAWVGHRPPAPGDWIPTLDDEFGGTSVDSKVWSMYGDNYWDSQSHWSRNDVILGGGVVRLRYEKRDGHNNDDPSGKETQYAAGYLHTYDRWAQRYGYFEARMRLPTAPGLWPAFWMMPDRGNSADPQWKRQDTGNGGMEFDIMEHLTRWGGFRYNIAMHYDGYGKDHKAIGSDKVYVQPDKQGFITCGLLWTPGKVVYYCNGKEVLQWENTRISSVPSMLMFTVPQGGWDNSPVNDARLPDDFTIDYVRVWQRRDLASSLDRNAGHTVGVQP